MSLKTVSSSVYVHLTEKRMILGSHRDVLVTTAGKQEGRTKFC